MNEYCLFAPTVAQITKVLLGSPLNIHLHLQCYLCPGDVLIAAHFQWMLGFSGTELKHPDVLRSIDGRQTSSMLISFSLDWYHCCFPDKNIIHYLFGSTRTSCQEALGTHSSVRPFTSAKKPNHLKPYESSM